MKSKSSISSIMFPVLVFIFLPSTFYSHSIEGRNIGKKETGQSTLAEESSNNVQESLRR